VLLAICITTTPARTAWPEQPVTRIMLFAPGGITDTLARMIAARFQSALGQVVPAAGCTESLKRRRQRRR